MELITGLQVPVMTRTVWNTLPDRERWEPILQGISTQWLTVERSLVASGIRGCTLQPLDRLQYLELLPWAFRNGLHVKIMKTVAKFNGFAHRYDYCGDDNGYLVTAIAREEAMLETPELHLGYPECCQAFFAANFPRILDPIWQWAGEQGTVSANPYSNPLLRYINVRFSPHIPCGPHCEGSIALGEAASSFMDPILAAQAAELLAMPTVWNCYRGIALVKNPLFQLVVGSVPTAKPYEVKINVGG